MVTPSVGFEFAIFVELRPWVVLYGAAFVPRVRSCVGGDIGGGCGGVLSDHHSTKHPLRT